MHALISPGLLGLQSQYRWSIAQQILEMVYAFIMDPYNACVFPTSGCNSLNFYSSQLRRHSPTMVNFLENTILSWSRFCTRVFAHQFGFYAAYLDISMSLCGPIFGTLSSLMHRHLLRVFRLENVPSG